jgi:hypothetical protein
MTEIVQDIPPKKFRVGDLVYCSAIRHPFTISDFGYDEEYQRWHYTFKGSPHWYAESTLTLIEEKENAAS